MRLMRQHNLGAHGSQMTAGGGGAYWAPWSLRMPITPSCAPLQASCMTELPRLSDSCAATRHACQLPTGRLPCLTFDRVERLW